MQTENKIRPTNSDQIIPELVGIVSQEEWDIFRRVKKLTFKAFLDRAKPGREKALAEKALRKELKKKTSSRVKKRAIRLQHLRLAGQLIRGQVNPAAGKVSQAFQRAMTQEPDPDLVQLVAEHEEARAAKRAENAMAGHTTTPSTPAPPLEAQTPPQ